ncbi:MAG: patatin-like phospholipase family protein, partial [Elusimicrobiota bacterium]
DDFLSKYFWREVITLLPPKRPRIAVVLSGGGARGLAHIGVLKVFKEEGVPIDVITGTSVGALVGALYCSGVSPEKIEEMAGDVGWADLTNISNASIIELVVAGKLLSSENMERYISENIGNKQFHELKTQFACTATDLKTGEKIIFREGDVASAVRASATIPGLFSPVEYRHRYLVDGGLVDNIPTDLARSLGADVVVAIDIQADFTRYSASNVLLALNQAIYIQGSLLSSESLKKADIVIQPKVSDVSAYELWRGRECIEAGIVAARQSMREIKRQIMDRTFLWLLKNN